MLFEVGRTLRYAFCRSAASAVISMTRAAQNRTTHTQHLYSCYGSKKLCFLQTPSKNEQNQKTKKPKHMLRTVKAKEVL